MVGPTTSSITISAMQAAPSHFAMVRSSRLTTAAFGSTSASECGLVGRGSMMLRCGGEAGKRREMSLRRRTWVAGMQ